MDGTTESIARPVIQIPLAPWLNVSALAGHTGDVALAEAGLTGQAGRILKRLACSRRRRGC